jgi:hypothetical protein
MRFKGAMAGPYREPSVPEPPPARGPDLDPEITTPEGHRARALLVSKEELARGGDARLEVHSLVRCEECAGVGCTACDRAGASVQKAAVAVRWIPGADDGDTVAFEGRGDVPGLRADVPLRAIPGGRGDLLVRVGTKKGLVAKIENAERRRRRRQRTFLEQRGAIRASQRRTQRLAAVALAVLLVGLGGLAAWSYLRKGAYGDPCLGPRDCRSDLCVKSFGFALGRGGFTEMRCSVRCSTDAECGSGNACKEIEDADFYGVPTGKTMRVCAPR